MITRITLVVMMSICFSYTVIYSVNVDSPSQQVDEVVNASEQGQVIDNEREQLVAQECQRVIGVVVNEGPHGERIFNPDIAHQHGVTQSMIQEHLPDNLGVYPTAWGFVIGERSQELPEPDSEDDFEDSTDDDDLFAVDADPDQLRDFKRRRFGS